MVVCPACGERATLETYEAWTPKDGWKKTERISCNNVRPKNGEPCGKKTVLKETRLDRDAKPQISDEPAVPPSAPIRQRVERSRPSRPAAEQPVEPVEATEAEEADTEVADEVESQASVRISEPEEQPAAVEQPMPDEDAEPDPLESVPMLDGGSRRFPKYSAEQYKRLISLVESGMTCPQAAQAVGIQVNTAYGIIGKYRRGLRSSDRRPVLTLVPPRTTVQVRMPVSDAPLKTSALVNQLKHEGVVTPGRLLSSTDLATFFRLPADLQEGVRLFHAMRREVAEVEQWADDVQIS